jgi:hypothetical protein
MKFMVEAIHFLAPDTSWSLIDEEYNNIIWHSTDVAKPSKESVLAKMAELQAEYDDKDYQRKRQLEYPLITDQLDMLWHMMDDETIPGKNSTWYNTIKEVKDNNPK